ncbi:hypothetical protein PM082_023699 [Marasmius tenuissimus]|nr:hypothetical protein PM082_023699 [Marasmius tenuissimus]
MLGRCNDRWLSDIANRKVVSTGWESAHHPVSLWEVIVPKEPTESPARFPQSEGESWLGVWVMVKRAAKDALVALRSTPGNVKHLVLHDQEPDGLMTLFDVVRTTGDDEGLKEVLLGELDALDSRLRFMIGKPFN